MGVAILRLASLNHTLLAKGFHLGLDQMPRPEAHDFFHAVNLAAEDDRANRELIATLRRVALTQSIGMAPSSRRTIDNVKERLSRMHDEFSALTSVLSHLGNETPTDAISKWAQRVIKRMEDISEGDFDFLKNDSPGVARIHAFVCRDFFHQVNCSFHENPTQRPEDIILEAMNIALGTYGSDPVANHFKANSIPMAKLAAKVMGLA